MWRSEVNFHAKRKTKMETLKTLCARSVAARVTLDPEKSGGARYFDKGSWAHDEAWKTRDVKPIKKNLSLVVLESMSYMRKCPYCKKHVNTGNNLYVNNAKTVNCNLKHQQQLDLTLEPRFFIPILE